MNLKKFFFRLMLSALISAASFSACFPGTAAAAGSFTYTVAEGDCLWLIAGRYGTTVETLKELNGLNSDFIQVGQNLIIPGEPSSAQDNYGSNSATACYTVTSGDCLWLIASKTGTTVEAIKEANGLESDMLQVGQVLVIPGTSAAYQPVSRGSASRPAVPSSGKEKRSITVEPVDWSEVDELFPRGSTAYLQDFKTGRQFQIYRLFGTNHADCEPLTAEDSRIMKEVFGGEWSWDRRPAVLLLNGRAIACSMAGMPHGTSQDIYGNDFDGHFDLHFLNSRTHETNRIDPDHQAAVRRAAGL
ncbi:MAG: LysM peptidoglycan-binding domain-containing protein [Pelotomaculum sp.]|uniref:LysM domain-containing protein n=1 Tax=Pelotomaculum thermopropionicum (strain DSM 13744 / JCM 10971 / SI) TaxID=370438 RepID=A5D3J7_PELTS|nr:LysM peptidoglycan-binding domain-containing protein [Pelotomaculum sp.]BAF59204.1 hypothetical protein PTH_1023 [Pelotomaculum thermopropionicum SI]